MPAIKKYTEEQREKVREMYAVDRSTPEGVDIDPTVDRHYSKGRYTLNQISKKTGVGIASVFAIATGLR